MPRHLISDAVARGWGRFNFFWRRRGSLKDLAFSKKWTVKDEWKAPPHGGAKNGKLFWWQVIFFSAARFFSAKSQSGEGGERAPAKWRGSRDSWSSCWAISSKGATSNRSTELHNSIDICSKYIGLSAFRLCVGSPQAGVLFMVLCYNV